jgi:hypothetical protein
LPGGVHERWKNSALGLISGGNTPICGKENRFGEAMFKDFWSDDTKNCYREES